MPSRTACQFFTGMSANDIYEAQNRVSLSAGHKKALQVLLKLQGAFLIYIGYTISSYLVLQQVEECYVQVLRRPMEME